MIENALDAHAYQYGTAMGKMGIPFPHKVIQIVSYSCGGILSPTHSSRLPIRATGSGKTNRRNLRNSEEARRVAYFSESPRIAREACLFRSVNYG